MRVMDLEMRTWYGSPAYFVLGAVHAIVFWITVSCLTPLILLVLLQPRRRLLHDMLVGHRRDQQPGAGRGLARRVRRPVMSGMTFAHPQAL